MLCLAQRKNGNRDKFVVTVGFTAEFDRKTTLKIGLSRLCVVLGFSHFGLGSDCDVTMNYPWCQLENPNKPEFHKYYKFSVYYKPYK